VTQTFEFGFETQSARRPSVQSARHEFLSGIARLKGHTVLDLFASAYQPYTELITRKSNQIQTISNDLESQIPASNYILRQPEFIRERAIKTIMPDWRALQKVQDADALCLSLRTWSERNNLIDEWCLDHAVLFLRAWDGSDEKKMAIALLPDPHYLLTVINRCWQSALLDGRLRGLANQFQTSSEIERLGLLSYVFKYDAVEFRVTGPFSKSIAAFKREVYQEFQTRDGKSVRGAKKALDFKLGAYLNKIRPVTTRLGMKAPHTRWAMHGHLNWLVQYQVPPNKTFREVARQVGKHERTIRDGIRVAANFIGITLRSSEKDKA